MSFFSKASSILRQTASMNMNHEIAASKPSIFQAIRCMSSSIGGISQATVSDNKRRLLAAKYELRRKLYKGFVKDASLPSDFRDKQRYKLSKLPRNSSFTRIRNRCIFTGRPRAVYQKFRCSRIVFRSLASQGALMGVKKASW